MNELTITVVGWAATDVRLFVGQGDLAIASFRVASTPRFFDRERSAWVDGVTEWFTVRAFRGAAYTVEKSISRGLPVVVSGRLRTNTWEAKDGPRTEHVIDATAVGPDCMRGVATFRRAIGDASLTEEDASAAAEAIAASRAATRGAADADGAERARDGEAGGAAGADGDDPRLAGFEAEDEPEPSEYEALADVDAAGVR